MYGRIPQISPNPTLCEVNPLECLSERRMLETMLISTSFTSSKNSTKLIQIFHPTLEFSLHSISHKTKMGVLEHCLTLMPRKRQMNKMLRRIGWNLREDAKAQPQMNECPTSYHHLIMNIIVWNSRGVLKPNF